jgi:CRP-like cAMP-binding protein
VEFPFLAGLDPETRRQLLRGARRCRFRQNEVLFHAGDAANSMHLLASGHLSVHVTTPMGDTVIFTVLGPGSTVGELALLSEHGERSATVTALDRVETMALMKDDFARLRQRHPEVDRFLVELLASYIRRQDTRLLEALYLPVEKRVLRQLVRLSHMYGDGSRGTVVPLTQETIAELCGSTRPTTNQVLRNAEAAGLIAIERGRIRVDDPVGLSRRAG